MRPAALSLGIALALVAPDVAADDVRKVCATAYEQAQYARKERKLRRAREQLILCAQPECPAATRNDCVPWLAEVEASLPTVVFGATDAAGKELTDVKVLVDDAVLVDRLDGAAVAVDPGPRRFLFQHAGAKDVEESFVIKEGEKNRILGVQFKDVGAAAASKAAPGPAAQAESSGASYWPAALLTGVGALGIGGAVLFGVGAKSDADDLRSTCAPRCSTSSVDDVRSKLLVSDVFLGVGVVSLALAAYFFIRPPGEKKPARAASIDLRMLPNGAGTSVGGRF
jgi:hypothetical protein